MTEEELRIAEAVIFTDKGELGRKMLAEVRRQQAEIAKLRALLGEALDWWAESDGWYDDDNRNRIRQEGGLTGGGL